MKTLTPDQHRAVKEAIAGILGWTEVRPGMLGESPILVGKDSSGVTQRMPDWTAETSPHIGAAWELVERLKPTHSYQVTGSKRDSRQTVASFVTYSDANSFELGYFDSRGYSDAVNISVAFLRASGVDVEAVLRGEEAHA